MNSQIYLVRAPDLCPIITTSSHIMLFHISNHPKAVCNPISFAMTIYASQDCHVSISFSVFLLVILRIFPLFRTLVLSAVAMQNPGPKWTLTALFLTFLCFVALHRQFFPSSFVPSLRASDYQYSISNTERSCRETRDHAQNPLTGHRFQKPQSIPNVIHFVRLVEEPNFNPTLDFSFHHFVAIYSAHFHMQPETIYIHTNIEEHLIKQSLKNSTNLYTRAINKLSNVKYNYHSPPNTTTKGIGINNLPHRSDFVRTAMLEKFGGIYLDDDVYLLREMHSLRHSGYDNVIGKQADGKSCNAVIMSSPGNKMISAYNALQDSIYDGGWETHSVFLLTALAREFAAESNQVLIVPQDTFFPLSWRKPDLETLYQVHDDIGGLETNNRSTKNLTDFTENFQLWPPESWRIDWRPSYTLHGWTTAIKDNFRGDEEKRELFGKHDGISLDYVMAQNSNFARALYPAVKDAVAKGFLKDLEVSQGYPAVGTGKEI